MTHPPDRQMREESQRSKFLRAVADEVGLGGPEHIQKQRDMEFIDATLLCFRRLLRSMCECRIGRVACSRCVIGNLATDLLIREAKDEDEE